jgi:hypothetical protein
MTQMSGEKYWLSGIVGEIAAIVKLICTMADNVKNFP